jgi:hypothetical protein
VELRQGRELSGSGAIVRRRRFPDEGTQAIERRLDPRRRACGRDRQVQERLAVGGEAPRGRAPTHVEDVEQRERVVHRSAA